MINTVADWNPQAHHIIRKHIEEEDDKEEYRNRDVQLKQYVATLTNDRDTNSMHTLSYCAFVSLENICTARCDKNYPYFA